MRLSEIRKNQLISYGRKYLKAKRLEKDNIVEPGFRKLYYISFFENLIKTSKLKFEILLDFFGVPGLVLSKLCSNELVMTITEV